MPKKYTKAELIEAKMILKENQHNEYLNKIEKTTIVKKGILNFIKQEVFVKETGESCTRYFFNDYRGVYGEGFKTEREIVDELLKEWGLRPKKKKFKKH
ncbi:hypothetical protein PL372_09600 [Tenacibaculum dicentrarchi]|nr:hypothetical protein [Tenacibaculum dicentrarchi]